MVETESVNDFKEHTGGFMQQFTANLHKRLRYFTKCKTKKLSLSDVSLSSNLATNNKSEVCRYQGCQEFDDKTNGFINFKYLGIITSQQQQKIHLCPPTRALHLRDIMRYEILMLKR